MKTPPLSDYPAINWEMSDAYSYFLTQEEYEWILYLALEQVSQRVKIISAGQGKITTAKFGAKNEDDETEIPLSGLFIKCIGTERSKWADIIIDYFQNFQLNQPKASELKKDLSLAKDHLRILIESEENIKKFAVNCITRKDFPGTYTFLALESGDFVHLVERDEIEWEASDDSLFRIALDNVAKEKIIIKPLSLGKAFDYFAFFSFNSSAVFLIELARNAPSALGKFGTIVAIPTSEAAFAYPINDINKLNFPLIFEPFLADLYQMGQIPINKTFYWYYEGKYEAFPVRMAKGKPSIHLPPALSSLIANTR